MRGREAKRTFGRELVACVLACIVSAAAAAQDKAADPAALAYLDCLEKAIAIADDGRSDAMTIAAAARSVCHEEHDAFAFRGVSDLQRQADIERQMYAGEMGSIARMVLRHRALAR